jgi:hypothetical protein
MGNEIIIPFTERAAIQILTNQRVIMRMLANRLNSDDDIDRNLFEECAQCLDITTQALSNVLQTYKDQFADQKLDGGEANAKET